MQVADKQHTRQLQNNARISCKFYLTSKQAEHVFHYLSRLITGQTLENNSSSSNSHAKFGQKSQTRAQVALFCQQPQPSSQQAGM